MNNHIDVIKKVFDQLVSRDVTIAELGHGSFITIGFGKNVEREVIRRGIKETRSRPEWYLWTYMCDWQLKMNDVLLVSSEDERDKIETSLKLLEHKKLIGFEVLSDLYDMKIIFENGIVLLLCSNNSDTAEGDVQWRLYTPGEKVLVAGPLKNNSYDLASRST
jgi:hypothetical protein